MGEVGENAGELGEAYAGLCGLNDEKTSIRRCVCGIENMYTNLYAGEVGPPIPAPTQGEAPP